MAASANIDAVKGQDSAYRRGLVLGLTMAEIMVLVLFLLLLALASPFARFTHSAEVLRQLQERLRKEQHIQGEVTVDDVVAHIERQRKEVETLRERMSALREYDQDAKILADIIHEITRTSGNATPEKVRQQLREVPAVLRERETLRGQIVQLSEQIKATGRGNEFPSCWVTATGEIESIFELTLTSKGVSVKERNPNTRREEKAALPLAQLQYDEELPLPAFARQMRPIYRWSVDHKCRFYVVQYSSVESAPVVLVNAIQGYFYPDSTIQYRPGFVPKPSQ